MQCIGCVGVHRASESPALLGVSPAVVRRLIRDGVLVRVRQGVLAGECRVEQAGADPTAAHLLAGEALLLRFSDTFASHETAAVAHNLPVLHLPSSPRATRPTGAWRSDAAGRVRVARLPAHHRSVVRGLRATSVPRTFIDIARSSTLASAVVVGDFVRRCRCTLDELETTLAECAAWSDVGKARRALAFLDPRAESPLESVSRVYLHEADVPDPDLQTAVIGASGRGYRADFYWDFARLIGEADGIGKYGATPDAVAAALRAEKRREDDLREAGFAFVRWDYAQMLTQTDATIARITRQLGCA